MMSERPHRVAVLALPAVIPLELGIATEIFGRDPHYRLTVCAEGRSASLPGSGLTVNTPAGLEGLKRAETLIIPGYEDPDATVSAPVLDAIRAAHARGERRRARPPSRLDARKPCTSARPRQARDPGTYVSTDVEPSVS